MEGYVKEKRREEKREREIVHIREHERGGRKRQEGRESNRKGEREREREREETVDAVFVRHEQSAKKKKTAQAAVARRMRNFSPRNEGKEGQSLQWTCGNGESGEMTRS